MAVLRLSKSKLISVSEISRAPTYDPVRFWRTKVRVTTGRQDGEGVHVDAGALSP